ncbi:MAG: hypothetical protein RL588_1019, partial [Pseudomonadota bacterium]
MGGMRPVAMPVVVVRMVVRSMGVSAVVGMIVVAM